MVNKNEKMSMVDGENSGNGAVDYRKKLMQGLTDVQVKNNALNSMDIINSNKIKDMKSNILKSLFEELANNGVDLNDPQSIKDFLDKLERTDPDLRELFEGAMDNLLPEEEPGQIEEEQPMVSPGNIPGTMPGGEEEMEGAREESLM
jgi:hypothetical protein